MTQVKPSPQVLASRFADAGLKLSAKQTEQLWSYHRHLRARNPELNMTRIYEFEAMVLKLYLDSALVGKLTDLPTPLLDIGTGPGFPGIPLAVLHPDVAFLLSEGRHKRNEFLKEVVKLLGLKNVEVLGHRIAPEYDRPVNGVITRAVEAIPETLYRVLRCLQPGGKAIFMKGPDCDEEIATAKKLAKYYSVVEDQSYRLLETEHQRRLVVFERTDVPAPQPAKGTLVTSADNPRLKLAKRLQASRQIRKNKLALAPVKAAREIMELEPQHVEQIIAREGTVLPPEAAGLPAMVVETRLYDDLVQALCGPYGAMLRVPDFGVVDNDSQLPEPAIVLGIVDPAELGSAIRSAVLYGWRRMVLTRECAHPFHPESLRHAGAAVYQAEFSEGPSVAEINGWTTGFRLEGVADLPGATRFLFVGPQSEPHWPPLGSSAEMALETGALLAVILDRFARNSPDEGEHE